MALNANERLKELLKDSLKERRMFPRLDATCPVLYQMADSTQWRTGSLVNFSATGLRIQCEELLSPGGDISIQIQPGKNRAVPAIMAKGRILRCELDEELYCEISCKLTKVSPVGNK